MTRSPTTQDISWFLDLAEKGQLNLDPPYQRRSVWSPKDRRYFIDTILNNYPAPPVFLHKTLDDNGRATYHVVDGKQRLQTILMFKDNKLAIPDDFSDVNLRKKKWNELERATRERFWNYIIIVEFLPDANEAAIRNTFERINRNSRKLTQQEMRHAKYEGWFVNKVEEESSREEWRTIPVVTAARSKRMADIQFMSELFAVIINGELQGFDQDKLDELYADYEEVAGNDLFVEEEFDQKLSACKGAVLAMIQADPRVREFLKAQGHLYSLWAFISSLDGPIHDIDGFTTRYLAFLDDVQAKLDDPNAPPPAHGDEPYQAAVANYAANIRGASTDKTPRQARHDALLTVFAPPISA
jgi:hypothetical protein